jgi:hypothetical protein
VSDFVAPDGSDLFRKEGDDSYCFAVERGEFNFESLRAVGQYHRPDVAALQSVLGQVFSSTTWSSSKIISLLQAPLPAGEST